MARTLDPLSKGEWRIMNVCWRLGKCTAREVYEAIPGGRQRDYQTLKTMLDRIADKGYLRVEKLGPLCLYSPAVSRRVSVARAIDDFVVTVLDGGVAPLFQHLTGGKRLTKEEAASLRKLLDEQKERMK